MKQITKAVFVTFRLTKPEKEYVLNKSKDKGFNKLSDYIRSLLEL